MNSLLSPAITSNRCASKVLSPQDIARQLAFTRREFLRSAAGLSLGSGLMASSLLSRTGIPVKKRKMVVVTFGGGARDQETFAKAPTLNSFSNKEMKDWFSAFAQIRLSPSLEAMDMGAYYNWLNQERLSGAKEPSFLAWFENHSQAVAIGPSMLRGTASTESATLANLLSWMA